jgi:hypothetical protein
MAAKRWLPLAALLVATAGGLRVVPAVGQELAVHAGLAGRAALRVPVGRVRMASGDDQRKGVPRQPQQAEPVAADGGDSTPERPRGVFWRRLRERLRLGNRLRKKSGDGDGKSRSLSAAAAEGSVQGVAPLPAQAPSKAPPARADDRAARPPLVTAARPPSSSAAPLPPAAVEEENSEEENSAPPPPPPHDDGFHDGVLSEAVALVEDITAQVQASIDSRRRRLNTKLGTSLGAFRDDVLDEMETQASAAKVWDPLPLPHFLFSCRRANSGLVSRQSLTPTAPNPPTPFLVGASIPVQAQAGPDFGVFE